MTTKSYESHSRVTVYSQPLWIGTELAIAVLVLALGIAQLRAADPTVVTPTSTTVSKPGALLNEQLNITIKKLHYDRVDIATMIRDLQQKSKELGPQKREINIVLDKSINPSRIIITLQLFNVPLLKVLQMIVQTYNLKMSFENDTVYLNT